MQGFPCYIIGMTEGKLERRTAKQWIQVEITDLLCGECGKWFTPKEQPPRDDYLTCPEKLCRMRSWRRRAREAKAGPSAAPLDAN